MKTYEEFRREVLAYIKRAEEMSLKPKEYSYAQIETMAAKEYAKQWVEKAQHIVGCCEIDPAQKICDLLYQIDAQ